MKACYADPPYLGCAEKHYGHLHAAAADYDDPETHRRLIERLSDEFDTWALSMAATNVRELMPMCPPDARMGVWCKSFASFKANVTRAYAWEPIIFRFHRPRTREQETWRDFIVEPITLRRGFTGAKPEKVCAWIFEGLNLEPGDEFTAAYERWRNRSQPEQFALAQ